MREGGREMGWDGVVYVPRLGSGLVVVRLCSALRGEREMGWRGWFVCRQFVRSQGGGERGNE